MQPRSQSVFLLLVLVQTMHAVEEYATKLYELFAPAAYLSGLISGELGVGFAVINLAFVVFGFWCYFGPVRSGRPSGRALAWLWVAVELANGVGHSGLALSAGGYYPGVVTAPVLVAVAAWLALLLLRDREPLRRAAS